MFSRALHSSLCASCRLRSSILAKQLARTRPRTITFAGRYEQGRVEVGSRYLSATSSARLDHHAVRPNIPSDDHGDEEDLHLRQVVEEQTSPEEAALRAREVYGDALPEGVLGEEGRRVYERLYGKPREIAEGEGEDDGGVLLDDDGTGVLQEGEGGVLEEVEFDEEIEDIEDEAEDGDELMQSDHDVKLAADIDAAVGGDATDGVEQYTPDYPGESGGEQYIRAHPLTIANRFGTTPSSLPMPQQSMVDTITQQLAGKANVHITEAVHRVFGGTGLPYSTSTPGLGSQIQQKPIGLDAAQSHMSEIDADAFMAALVPGMYATVMSGLVETRKRLGSAWAEKMVAQAERGELRILDAGGAGAGVLAVRELLRAEWERVHEDRTEPESGMALAEADGKVGGASISPPLGLATVLTGSDTLRKRSSGLLENTTFLPRLPDYLHAEEAQKKGKFDIIIAPYTLWQLKENYVRKSHLQNLWGMLSQNGGIMLVVEKGIPRGFELVAEARNTLLETRIANTGFDAAEDENASRRTVLEKDKGMIVAPCTNHESCPMYQTPGMVKGRRDICHFEQRYTRPAFLQRILGAKSKNWEDVKFSYLSVMRGRDLREEAEQGLILGEEATARAFEGYADSSVTVDGEAPSPAAATTTTPHSLSLPRAVLPPLKRQGHIILDLCTPSGTLERWTVPRSFGKQAFRDARKSAWGDLWALGAKTSVPRIPKIKKRKSNADLDVEGKVKGGKGGLGVDEYGRIVSGVQRAEGDSNGGLMRGRRVKGVRDKRDKKGDGNGRRKRRNEV